MCRRAALRTPPLPLESGPHAAAHGAVAPHSPSSESGHSGPCHAVLLSPWLKQASAPIRCRAQEPSLSGLSARKVASEDPLPPSLPCGAEGTGPLGSDSAAGLLSAGVRVPGSPPGYSPQAGPFPPDAACCSGRGRLPVSVTLRSARENSMPAPRRRGPHPSTSHPPLPSWQGDRGKAANFKSAQRLWSCPELSTINHGASDFCFASEGGVGTPGSFCLLRSAPGFVLITNRQDAASLSPRGPLLAPLTVPLAVPSSRCLLSLPLPSVPSDPHPRLCQDLILHTPLPLVLFPASPSIPSGPPASARMQISLAFFLYVFTVNVSLFYCPFFFLNNLMIAGFAPHPITHVCRNPVTSWCL